MVGCVSDARAEVRSVLLETVIILKTLVKVVANGEPNLQIGKGGVTVGAEVGTVVGAVVGIGGVQVREGTGWYHC